MKVYIAGPIRLGDWTTNIRAALEAANELFHYGLMPYVPHLSCFWDLALPGHTVDDWLALDRTWLLCCEALLLLPGASEGASREVRWAVEYGIPVFHDVKSIVDWKARKEIARVGKEQTP